MVTLTKMLHGCHEEFNEFAERMDQELDALSLPDILTARAGDRLRRMLLFQRFLTNRTVFLPHVHTGPFYHEWA